MISFLRRALSSWIVLGLLGLVLIAFIVTGVSGPSGSGPNAANGGTTVAKAGGISISAIDLSRRMQNQFDRVRREQPTLEPKTFVAAGGFDQVTDALITARALDAWGRAHGFAISKRLVDAEIAGIPAFRGVTGQFDEKTMRALLSQQRISERDLRNDIASDLLRSQVLTPVAAGLPVPVSLAKPYANLLVELRTGQVGIIPLAAVADTRQPTDAEIAAAYKSNIATYTRPETRVLRYALFGPANVADKAKPSDAEITAYYEGNATKYAARQTRNLSQIIVPTEAAAKAIAAKAASGASLAAAATQAGLEASTLTDQVQADYAKTANAQIAQAAFAAAKGALVGPIKGAFGWYVVKVDAITGAPARSLDQVRGEIVTTLTKQKADAALSDLATAINDAIDDGSSFDEVAKSNKLIVTTTPPVLANGTAPDTPDWKAPPEVAALLRPGFEAGADDKPTVETVIKGEQFAVFGVRQVIAPTPLPLARVRDAVARDIIVTRTRAKARAIATAVTAKVNKGMPLAAAMAGTGVKLPPVQPASARQIDLSRVDPKQVPPPVRALFDMKPGQARSMPADNGGAYFVVVLSAVAPGDFTKYPGLVDNTRGELSQASSTELAEQFMKAVQQDVGVTRNADAIAQVKRQFSGAQ
jgi:peptidyl-prolyl cis-trans isomerase D